MTGRTGRPVTPVTGRPAQPDPAVDWPDPEVQYREWLDRVRSTYRAVHFTCAHRLGDPALAGPVAVRVVAGLLARPTVFRYFGLPFSGRIATLAEAGIAEAERTGEVPGVGDWPDLEARLLVLPEPHRATLLAVCVRGEEGAELAASLGCDEERVATRRSALLRHLHDEVAAGFLDGSREPDETDREEQR